MITDKNGNWPDSLEWAWLENRHIIRAIVEKGVRLWYNQKNDKALQLFRKLLKTNPNDNPGVRFYILAIKMNMTFERFEERFVKGGYYGVEIDDWFNRHFNRFPEEFGWWEKMFDEDE